MATISITLTTPQGAQTITSTLPDAMAARLRTVYGVQQVDTGTKDAQNQPIMRAPTNKEILQRCANEMFQAVKYRVQNHEREEANKVLTALDMGTPT